MGIITFRDLLNAFRALEIDPSQPVIAHAALGAFGRVYGGPQVMVGALLATFPSVIMPSFTYKTMVTPEIGPQNNALNYGKNGDSNHLAEIYHPDMPADPLMGIVPETLRKHPKAQRSGHPLLSFVGVNAEQALEAQTLDEPLAPIRIQYELNGWALLIGTDHMTNTSIHLGERLAGRKQFVRWALTSQGVIECPGFPGCSDGFQAIQPYLISTGALRSTRLGPAEIQAIPLQALISTVQDRLRANPLALLCEYPECMRCQAVRDQHEPTVSVSIPSRKTARSVTT